MLLSIFTGNLETSPGIEEMLIKRLAYLPKNGILLVWLHNECFVYFNLIVSQNNELCSRYLNFLNYFYA